MKTGNKILSVLLSVVMLLSVCAAGFTAGATDEGIVWNDAKQYYVISDYAGLKEFAAIVNGTHGSIGQNKYACAVLTADIDASASASANDWTPIGSSNSYYKGTFDGRGHKITCLTFNNPGWDCAGLFGIVELGVVQNVGLEGGSITGNYYIGGIVGENLKGQILNCWNTGSVSGEYHVGGVVGINHGTVASCWNAGSISGKYRTGGITGYNFREVTNCHNTGTVNGDSGTAGGVVGGNTTPNSIISGCYNSGYIFLKSGRYLGGIAGENYEGQILNCYNTGNLYNHLGSGYMGGIVGENYSTVTNCYNTGTVKVGYTDGSGYISGVVGYNESDKVTNCYYDKESCGEIGAVNCADDETNNNKGLTIEQMTAGTYSEDAVTNMPGFSSDAWLVRQADDFYSYYPHLKGINLDGSGAQIPAEKIYRAEWPKRILKDPNHTLEITNYDQLKVFAGKVNVGNAEINGILINDIDASASDPSDPDYDSDTTAWTPIGNNSSGYAGTFDGSGKKITGLTFNNTSADYVGLFGRVSEGGIVQNVGLEGGSITGQCYVGGVVGCNSGNSLVENCYNTGSVKATASGIYVGGVVGFNYSSTISNCYNTGAVSSNDNVGGVVGYNYLSSTISNCYNTGNVSGNNNVGGVVGFNDGSTISNCYNTGSVTATAADAYAGGVVGFNYSSTISNCYNTGAVSGNDNKVGGVVGENYTNSKVSNCYFDSDRAPGIPAIGRELNTSNSNVEGFTTAQMTGANALENMVFEFGAGEVSPWQTKANGADVSGKYFLFYPNLKGFDYDLTAASEDWPAKVEVSVTWEEPELYDYSGSEIKPVVTSVIIGDASVPAGEDATYFEYSYSEPDNRWEWKKISGFPTETGKYRMEFDNDDGVVETKYFTILEADSDYTVKYYKNLGNGWSSESVDPVDVGEYKAVLTFTDTGYLKGQPPIEKAFDIAQKAVAVTACGPDGPVKAYNGQEQSYTGSVIWIYDREETGLDDSKLRYTGNTTVKGTDAGRHSVDLSAEYCFCDDSNYDVTFTAEGDFDFDIAQSVLNITADDLETNYGEDLAGLTYKIEPRFGSYYNEEELNITLSTDADKNSVGTYDIRVTVQDNPNYLINTQDGTYTVSKADPGATVTAEDTDYGQKAVVTFTAPADAKGKVTFYLDAADTGITKDIENGQAVCEFEKLNIGSHSVECVYTGDGNYESGETKTAGFEVKSVDCPLTVNYVYASGSEAYETYTDNVAIFTQYSVTSPEITGYTPDIEKVEGRMENVDGVTVTVTYTAVKYTATFVYENGEPFETREYTVETKSIEAPEVPAKEGYTGKWEEYKLTPGGITVKPVYTEIAEEPVTVNGNRSSTLGYKENQTFTADTTGLPEGAEVHWFVNGEDAGTGSEYTVVGPKDDYTVQAKVIDKDGNVLSESAEQSIMVKHGFLDKVLFFFAYLLKLLLTPVWYLEDIL